MLQLPGWDSDACAAPLASISSEDPVQAVLGGVQVSSQHLTYLINNNKKKRMLWTIWQSNKTKLHETKYKAVAHEYRLAIFKHYFSIEEKIVDSKKIGSLVL